PAAWRQLYAGAPHTCHPSQIVDSGSTSRTPWAVPPPPTAHFPATADVLTAQPRRGHGCHGPPRRLSTVRALRRRAAGTVVARLLPLCRTRPCSSASAYRTHGRGARVTCSPKRPPTTA